jgi:hypothetical protein
MMDRFAFCLYFEEASRNHHGQKRDTDTLKGGISIVLNQEELSHVD